MMREFTVYESGVTVYENVINEVQKREGLDLTKQLFCFAILLIILCSKNIYFMYNLF